MFRPYTHFYSIQNNSDGIPALFETTTTSNNELVTGIMNMQILFGEDLTNDGSANRYVTASGVADMNNVVSVRVSLLLETTEDNLVSTPQPYVFNGQTITPSDKKLRRVYTTTVVLRNN